MSQWSIIYSKDFQNQVVWYKSFPAKFSHEEDVGRGCGERRRERRKWGGQKSGGLWNLIFFPTQSTEIRDAFLNFLPEICWKVVIRSSNGRKLMFENGRAKFIWILKLFPNQIDQLTWCKRERFKVFLTESYVLINVYRGVKLKVNYFLFSYLIHLSQTSHKF